MGCAIGSEAPRLNEATRGWTRVWRSTQCLGSIQRLGFDSPRPVPTTNARLDRANCRHGRGSQPPARSSASSARSAALRSRRWHPLLLSEAEREAEVASQIAGSRPVEGACRQARAADASSGSRASRVAGSRLMLRTRTSGDAAQLLVDEAEDWTEDEPAVGLQAAEGLAIAFVLWPPRAVAIASATPRSRRTPAQEDCFATDLIVGLGRHARIPAPVGMQHRRSERGRVPLVTNPGSDGHAGTDLDRRVLDGPPRHCPPAIPTSRS